MMLGEEAESAPTPQPHARPSAILGDELDAVLRPEIVNWNRVLTPNLRPAATEF
jgi:hypothetical protein